MSERAARADNARAALVVVAIMARQPSQSRGVGPGRFIDARMEKFPRRFKGSTTGTGGRFAPRHEYVTRRVRAVNLPAAPMEKDNGMQTIDLIVLACMLANPSACREHHLLVQTAG